MKINPIEILEATTIDDLRIKIVTAVNDVIDQINRTDMGTVDARGKRVVNVADPIYPTDGVNYQTLDSILNKIDKLQRFTSYAVANGGRAIGTGTSPTSVTVVEYTLTSNTMIASPFTPDASSMLLVYVTQGAGPYTITFDPEFHSSVNTAISPTNGSVTVFSFNGRSDNLWWPVAAPNILE